MGLACRARLRVAASVAGTHIVLAKVRRNWLDMSLRGVRLQRRAWLARSKWSVRVKRWSDESLRLAAEHALYARGRAAGMSVEKLTSVVSRLAFSRQQTG